MAADPGIPADVDWGRLGARYVHPTKVAIIEAIRWIGEPLSARDLREVFDNRHNLSLVAYHLRTLADTNMVVVACERKVRGATQRFYALLEPI